MNGKFSNLCYFYINNGSIPDNHDYLSRHLWSNIYYGQVEDHETCLEFTATVLDNQHRLSNINIKCTHEKSTSTTSCWIEFVHVVDHLGKWTTKGKHYH